MDFECSDWQTRKMVISPLNSTPGKTYGLIKTHKRDNPVRFSTSSCYTVIKNLPTCIDQVFMSYWLLTCKRRRKTCYSQKLLFLKYLIFLYQRMIELYLFY